MTYQYTPLNKNNTEIRLLHLLPGKREDVITILIEHESFTDDHTPEYEALSYTWGDPDDRANIVVGPSTRFHMVRKVQRQHRSLHSWTGTIRRCCNFRNMWKEHTLSVTRNLAEALTYLRREDLPRVFWIDAICVNQADLDERSRQVSLMASLYSQARTVAVWLGPEAQNSDIAFSCIELLSNKVLADWDGYSLFCLTDDRCWTDKELPHPFGVEELVALEHIFNRPWFERLWVWQEVRLGGERAMVQCGDRLLKWQDFPNALLWFNQPHLAAQRLPYSSLRGALCICDPRSYTLSGLLAQARNLKCQDPRDKLFAILSLLESQQSLLYVRADYSKSVSQVYIDAAIECIFHNNDLTMLEYITTPQITTDLPSWVPDWNVEHVDGVRQRFFMAFCSSFSEAPWDLYQNKLKLQGKLIGTIKAVQPVLDGIGTSWDVAREIVELVLAQDGFFRQSLDTRSGLEALCRTLCTGDFANSREPVRSYQLSLPDAVEALADALRVTDRLSDDDYRSNKSHQRFWTHASQTCWRRSLVLLEDGSLGIAPTNAMPGDRISVILGCNSAMTLRKVEDDTFQVIGGAYIDGFMQGEAILGSLPAHITPVLRQVSTGGGGYHLAFRNEENGRISNEDPRLGPLPPGWKRLSRAFAHFWPRFENEETGDLRSHRQDPRCDVESLVARGVELQALELV
jgi:hypothetical protein